MAYELPRLPYPYNALEPHIDARTMEIHHTKHHNAYVTNLNKAIEGTDFGSQSIESLVAKIDCRAGKDPHRRPQQRRRPCQPFVVLDDHGARAREARRPASWPTPSRIELGGFDAFKQSFANAGADAVRQRLGLVERGQEQEAGGGEHAEPGQPVDAWQRAGLGHGRLGTRLLSAVSESASRLHCRFLQRDRLGCCCQAVRSRAK